jgi:hypothetical protein
MSRGARGAQELEVTFTWQGVLHMACHPDIVDSAELTTGYRRYS